MSKIAQVTAYWGPAYPTGSGVFCYEISRRLARDFEVHAFTSSVGKFNGANGDGINLHPLRTYGTVWNMNPVADVFSKLITGSYDIVHVHSYIFFMSNMAALARVFKPGSKYILHFHGGLDFTKDLAQSHPGRIWAKEHVYDKTLGRFTARVADRVLSVAKRDIELVAKKFGVKDVGWVPIAVDTDKFVPAPEKPDPPVVTYVGKLEAWKGIDTLLETFAIINQHMKNVRFLVVGAGSMESKLTRSGLPIEFMGPVPYLDMPSIYQRSSVLVLPSYMEGFPVTCVEALSCEVPVVTTNVGDTPEIVLPGDTGYLARPGDSGQIAEWIMQILADGALARRLGENGRQHVQDSFSYDAIVEKVIAEYERLGVKGPEPALKDLVRAR